MFLLKVVQRFSPCRFSQPLSNIHISAAGARTAVCAAGIKGLPLKNLEPCCHAVRRSFLSGTSKVQNSTAQPLLLGRCFSTSPSKLSEEGRLIYTGNLGKAVLGVKMFSYTSSGASLLLMPQILLKTGFGVDSLALQVVFCSIIGFFTFVTPLLLHFITRNYVVRLYHNADTDTYTAVTVSIFLVEKKTIFHQKQVKIPAVGGMFTSFYAGKTGLLVNPMLFPLPHDYNHLMGYDQPFTFDTDNVD